MTTNFQPPEGFVQDDLFSGQPPTRRRKRLGKYAHQRNKTTHFMDLPRAKRRKMAASLGWLIRTDPHGLGVFTSHQAIPGSRDYPLQPGQRGAGWVDFYCMSMQPLRAGVFFNGYATTVVMEALSEMKELAKQAADDLLSEDERAQDRPQAYSKRLPGKRGGSRMVFAPHPTFEALNGLTTDGYAGQWLLERLDTINECVSIRPRARLCLNYSYGVGLEMLIASPGITVESLAQEIEKFRERGEVAYEDDPVDLTPYMTELRDHLEATAWSLLSMDAHHRDLPDPTPPDIVARSANDLQSVPVRL